MNGLKYLALVTQVGVTMIASVGICIAVGFLIACSKHGRCSPSFFCLAVSPPFGVPIGDRGHIRFQRGAQVMFDENDVAYHSRLTACSAQGC